MKTSEPEKAEPKATSQATKQEQTEEIEREPDRGPEPEYESEESKKPVQPKIIVESEESVYVEGLPAISSDGLVLAVRHYFDTTSDEALLAVDFQKVEDDTIFETIVIWQLNEEGRPVPTPGDQWGNTTWRRAKNVTTRFIEGGFKSLTYLKLVEDEQENIKREYSSHGISVKETGKKGRLVIRDEAAGKRLFAGFLPKDTYNCGMEDSPPHERPTQLIEAFADENKKFVVISYGFEYVSCMCENLVKYKTIHIDTGSI